MKKKDKQKVMGTTKMLGNIFLCWIQTLFFGIYLCLPYSL